MDLALKAIAEPRRRAILHLVRNEERSSGEIAAQFEVSGPAISQHLTVLKTAGLVTERREGTRRLYRMRPQGMAEIRRFVEDFWDDGLSRLRDVAELDQRTTDKER